MTITELQDLFEYNRWAHENTLHAAGSLALEKYNARFAEHSPSLRTSLQRMLAEEVAWLSRWEGHSLAETPDYSECADTAALEVRWKSLWSRQRSFLASLNEDELSRLIAIRMNNGVEGVQSLSDTMVHVVNQATYMRGQAAGLIAQHGGTVPDSDFFTYCAARGPDGSEATIAP